MDQQPSSSWSIGEILVIVASAVLVLAIISAIVYNTKQMNEADKNKTPTTTTP